MATASLEAAVLKLMSQNYSVALPLSLKAFNFKPPIQQNRIALSHTVIAVMSLYYTILPLLLHPRVLGNTEASGLLSLV